MVNRYTLIKDINFNLWSKNSLVRLGVTTFGDLLDISYNRLEFLSENILRDIKTQVHNNGYLLLDEKTMISEKREELIENGYVTLDMLGFKRNLYLVLYRANIFTIDDLKKVIGSLFKIQCYGPVRSQYLKKDLERLGIDLEYSEDSLSDILINELKIGNNKQNVEVNFSSIVLSDIDMMYIKLVDDLENAGIYTLENLVKYNYQELKEKVGLSDICLVELLNFINSIGLEIKGYDQTNFRFQEKLNNSSKKRDVKDKVIEKSDVLEEKNLNVEIEKRIDEKETLLDEYNSLMKERMKLLEREKELDAKIDRILDSLKGKRYERKR